MRITQFIATFLSGTAVAERLEKLIGLYDESEKLISDWKEKSEVSCTDGCGICCERFMPDILPVEADLIAVYLLAEHPEYLRIPLLPDRSFCPLYEPDSRYHCPVYPVRPLTCRLFGFASSADKSGNSVYKPCREMPATVRNPFEGSGYADLPGGVPPTMGEFGFRLVSIDSQAANDRRLLPEALGLSLKKIRYLAELADPENFPDGTGPQIISA